MKLVYKITSPKSTKPHPYSEKKVHNSLTCFDPRSSQRVLGKHRTTKCGPTSQLGDRVTWHGGPPRCPSMVKAPSSKIYWGSIEVGRIWNLNSGVKRCSRFSFHCAYFCVFVCGLGMVHVRWIWAVKSKVCWAFSGAIWCDYAFSIMIFSFKSFYPLWNKEKTPLPCWLGRWLSISTG